MRTELHARRIAQGKRQNKCKGCGRAGMCQHSRVRSQCKDCGARASMTTAGATDRFVQGLRGHEHRQNSKVHGHCIEGLGARERIPGYDCRDCGGAGPGMCEHSRVRTAPTPQELQRRQGSTHHTCCHDVDKTMIRCTRPCAGTPGMRIIPLLHQTL